MTTAQDEADQLTERCFDQWDINRIRPAIASEFRYLMTKIANAEASHLETIDERDRLKGEIARLAGLLNTPETEDFLKGVQLESAHQVQRWGDEHDRSKSAENWFWLIAYLSGKALRAHIDGDTEKALHHCISSAAALKQWHASIRAGIINGQDADLAAMQTDGGKL